MIVRSVDVNNDWTFGKGKNNYRKDLEAVAQNIKTVLHSFLGDCFFDLRAGIDWFAYNGSKQEEELKIAISTAILGVNNIVSINEILASVGTDRNFLVQYEVQSSFGTITGEV